ncbi:MAG: hypothetical protein IKY90_08630 [Oscillospiraceae bacterium]|nr:hypothetical protein [Oscillospiraceae bacterium]
MKFKVGDRVKNTFNGDIGTIIELGSDNDYLVEFDNKRSGYHSGRFFSKIGGGKPDHCAWCPEKIITAVKPENETIVIFRRGSEVIALDKRTDKRGVAKCNPEDEFDFMVGAKLRFGRLVGEEKPVCKFKVGDKVIGNKKASKCYSITREGWVGRVVRVVSPTEIEVEDNPKATRGMLVLAEYFDLAPELYNGKAVCVNNSANERTLTVGKIYQFKDGFMYDDKGYKRHFDGKPSVSLEDFNSRFLGEFIEVVE